VARHCACGSCEVRRSENKVSMNKQVTELAQAIHALRNTAAPSQIILLEAGRAMDPGLPVGVLLLKPSSGHFPLKTIGEILERLVVHQGYRICSVVWWRGRDLRANGMMSLHYPGFHRSPMTGGAPCPPRILSCYSNVTATLLAQRPPARARRLDSSSLM
jgi:hypothetical protein